MTHAIQPGVIPPVPGLEKEEPELRNERDIPSDDDKPQGADKEKEKGNERPMRDVERE
jgi:hypothetical protein